MGNQGSVLNDEPNTAIAQRNLQHFDHTFKASLYSIAGSHFVDVFGELKMPDRPVSLVCKASSMDLVEDVGITARKQVSVSYPEITAIGWDHANSQIKVTTSHGDDSFVILTLSNSVEFEGEMKLRLSSAAATTRGMKIPSPMYVGMFAGAHKPKPFQRKRPNLTHMSSGKLPPLPVMRTTALDLHRGSYRPCPQGESRRMEIALQHIYEGCNTFPLLNVRGASSVANQFRSGSVLVITDEALQFKPIRESPRQEEFLFDDIKEWNAIDNDNYRMHDSGIEVSLANGDSVFFGVEYIRDVKHSLEYFWNTHKASTGRYDQIKKGSTHGRPIVTVHTLSGETPAPEAPVGQTEVVDQDGTYVRPGGKLAPRRASIAEGIMSTSNTKDLKSVPSENRDVKKHWHKVVMHQGWLLKQGGVGVGTNKQWIKRYFVLYKTSQGHFLVYYSDFTECPMYTSEKHHRNVIDISKTTFIRPGSNKAENPETPPYCFDIVTTEREWTLCAESQENVQKWLKLMTRAVDEDVAILPDEELIFKVKPKLDPLQVLPATDYSTSLRVSANGISVCIPDPSSKDGAEKEVYFWVYTDFYKWSLICPDGKLALLVNVFADSSFSRRYEYVFRNKEASRLATAIEYFIEKFMSVMHVRLETSDGTFEDEEQNKKSEGASGGMHQLDAADVVEQGTHYGGAEIDLLGLEMDAPPAVTTVSYNNATSNPFDSDPFGGPPKPPSAPAPVAPPSNTLDLFGSDDPFGSDPFGSSFSTAVTVSKDAPPLTAAQISLHKQWLLAAMGANGGPLYDDGTLKISSKVEVKLSLGRLTLAYINSSNSQISDLSVSITDGSQLTQLEIQPVAATVAPLATVTQVIRLECMKPAFPGPKIQITYTDPLHGKRSNTLDLPILLCTFNEALAIAGSDFMAKWNALSASGLEVQQVIRPPARIVPTNVHSAMTSILKFSRIAGIPDSSDFVIYGAGSLKTGAKGPNGDKISVGALIKIEMNVEANALRVTIRTVHPAASAALMETVKSLFN